MKGPRGKTCAEESGDDVFVAGCCTGEDHGTGVGTEAFVERSRIVRNGDGHIRDGEERRSREERGGEQKRRGGEEKSVLNIIRWRIKDGCLTLAAPGFKF